ncbi:2-succinyl-6-hydroxy-2, 4-cyclohexadiene-1-carboxylate synthase [Cupriavidus yeoncheonensis]|uniref:2-succinyl-6-hydroxy-2, 4-cyclohexadiene-1-carboxylate synthase n=1 Tax=Cupriavidus yeoncheonensis TaxID=1462994 RepID=A0A916IN83_9BURK|nr:alpha/beta hydrolase [Cupriavidus yeoncheonensis]CAG2127150.1 2-succinyl-6-hydroxy-2, 4-cyclohexadiene-1-carboxylate synthase [Cupriavidus yeoncheonensis]
MHQSQNGTVATIGNGPIHVIGLHGWFGHAGGWGPLVDVLDGDRFTYAFIDYRGYGSRRRMPGGFDLQEIAADVLSLADELGWQRFSLMGHSMGGKAMQAVAMLAPARVNAMVGITPVPPTPVPFDVPTRSLFERAACEFAARVAVVDHSTGARLSRRWVERIVRASVEHADPDAFAAYFRAWADTDFSADIAGTTIPTLLLVGEHDPSLTVDVMQQTYGRAFADLAIDEIPNAGHYPMDETPVDLATRIERFLTAADHRGRT